MLLSRSRSGPEEGINTKTRSMSKLMDSSEIKPLSRGPVSPGSCSWHHWRGQPSFPQRSWLPVWTERCPSQREARCQSLRLFLRGAEKSNQTGLFHTSKSVRLVSHCSDSAVGHFTSACNDPWLKFVNNKSGISNFLEVTIYHFTTQPEAASPKFVNAVTWKWGEPRLLNSHHRCIHRKSVTLRSEVKLSEERICTKCASTRRLRGQNEGLTSSVRISGLFGSFQC